LVSLPVIAEKRIVSGFRLAIFDVDQALILLEGQDNDRRTAFFQ